LSFVQIVLIIVFLATTLGLTMLQGWRRLTIALAIQYLGVFVALVLVWPVGMAAMKLIAGWMATAILVTNQPADIKAVSQSKWSLVFKGLVFVFIWLVVFATGAILSKITSIPQPFILMGMILLWGGLIQLGMSRDPMRIIIGLLTVLSGFEIIYSYVEPSLLVAALLAAVTLGLAFIGSYLFSVPDMEERE
jgi:hypothetical protein